MDPPSRVRTASGSEAEAIGGPDCVDKRPAGATAAWVESGLGVDLDVGIELGDETPKAPERGGAGLVRHEPAGQLHLGARWNRGFDARPRVPADHSMEFAGRQRPQSAHHFEWVRFAQRADLVVALEGLDRKAGREECALFSGLSGSTSS